MNADCTLGNGSLGTDESLCFVLEEGTRRMRSHRPVRIFIGNVAIREGYL